ncbi:SCO family protein [Thalassobacillus sp. CUG 92003]|uniref:SCO family protein n=1 Tax=Thalassobacillus sp. CUG 92003 TaxID=2736641 RepID=UPI0015E788B3|nr:SCO family protein [Thalassobacillus sp. CUG 92003]
MTRQFFLGTVVLLIAFLSACGSKIDSNMSREVHSLKATNQSDEPINIKEHIQGEYVIADFIFTNCNTVCPPMTGNMSRLQQLIKDENLDAKLVSFSVDPERDTPKQLKQFAEPYQPDYEMWDFVTGYSFKDIKEFSIKSFQSPLEKDETSDQMFHGTSFYLINPEGEVIKRYNGQEAEEMQNIVDDLNQVQ